MSQKTLISIIVLLVFVLTGLILIQFAVGERGVLEAEIPTVTGKTLYSRAPWLIPMVAMVVFASAILLFFKERIR